MMKKLLKSVFLTIPEVLSALLLLLFHLYFFTMIGMLVLPTDKKNDDGVFESPTGFERLDTAIVSLLVLLTTGYIFRFFQNFLDIFFCILAARIWPFYFDFLILKLHFSK